MSDCCVAALRVSPVTVSFHVGVTLQLCLIEACKARVAARGPVCLGCELLSWICAKTRTSNGTRVSFS